MRLKSFYAKTMTEAMQMIRHELGEDAIIVATREENGGKAVRVTAAIDRSDDGPAFEISPSAQRAARKPAAGVPQNYLQYDAEEDAEDAVHEILTETMLRHGIPSDISDNILSTAVMTGMVDAPSALTTSIEHSFTFAPLPAKSHKALMLIGAPGAGKTLATAKLAARGVMSGQKVAVISTDTVRAGGVEQLEAFTKLLNIPLQKARNAKELRVRIEASRGNGLILIDTGGCNPFDVDDMRGLAGQLDSGTIEPVLVMAAGGDAEESAEMARCFAVLGVQRLMPTRLDIARRMGGLLAAAGRSGIAFSDGSNTPMVADGIVPLSAQKISQLLLPQATRSKTVTTANTRGAAPTAPTKSTRRTG
ncbi:MAG: GTPase [Alphaproteobacteria bacterium]|nr:GTPase [Alphaproteobacteria bacterium]